MAAQRHLLLEQGCLRMLDWYLRQQHGSTRVSETIFVVEDAADGGLVAKAVGASIVTEAASPLRVGTLAGILAEVADQFGLSRGDLLQRLFP